MSHRPHLETPLKPLKNCSGERMLNPKTNEVGRKKDGKWSPTLFCAIMHGTLGVFFLRFRHNARHDVSAPNKGVSQRFSQTVLYHSFR